MAFTNVIRKAVLYSSVPAALYLFTNSSSADTIEPFCERVSNVFKTPREKFDSTLVKMLNSKIQDRGGVVDVPKNFRRGIEYGDRTLKLTKNDGERIDVVVHKPPILPLSDQSPIRMKVKVYKGRFSYILDQYMVFDVSGYPDRIEINSLRTAEDESAKRSPKKFRELDENLQKAFHKYLDFRGIDACLVKFLHKHINEIDDKEYTSWLQDIRRLVSK